MTGPNARDIYGEAFPCECGRTHTVEPRESICAADALDRLGAVCARYCHGRRVAVLMDVRTREVAGRRATETLAEAGWEAREVLIADLPEGRSPVCDDRTKAALSAPAAGTDLIVAVGSGVISDLGKWLALDEGRPQVTFATAPSMNGYPAGNIATTVEGVKTITDGRPPRAVLADPTILAEAPYEMITSGLGDVLAKTVSTTDWRLNHLLFGDYYCARSAGLIAEIEPLYLANSADLKQRSTRAVGPLYDALLLTGVAMNLAGSSAPASGGEHLIAHSLDMIAGIHGQPHDLHGRQVGVTTVLAAELYRRVLATESPDWREGPTAIDRSFWGPMADVVTGHFAGKPDRLRVAGERLRRRNAWDHLREELAGMLHPPERIHACLAAAGAACGAEDVGCSKDRLLAALTHGNEIRNRFTILDLAVLAGIMPAAGGEIVEMWA